MKAKILLLSLAASAAMLSYADNVDDSKYLQIRIKSESGLVVGGTEKPILVQPADNDDSQVFYIIQSTHSNWPDGRPATYPGYFLKQKSSGKYIVESSFDDAKGVGTLAFIEGQPAFVSNGHGVAPDCLGHWVPNDNASQKGVYSQISLNQESHRFCAIDKNNEAMDTDIEDVLLGAAVGVCNVEGLISTAFSFDLYNYTGDIWLRGPGLTGKSGDWDNSIKLEKDASEPGVYYLDSFNAAAETLVRFTLQNESKLQTLSLAPVYRSAMRIPFTINDEDEFIFVPWQYYHGWQFTKFGEFHLVLDLNTNILSIMEGKGEHTSGVKEIESIDADDTSAVYYNLQGMRVANPEKGIYIRVSGGKTSKVVKN